MAAAFSSLVSILQDRGEANDEAAVLETVLLRPREVDALLRYSSGRTRRLALKGLIAHIILPDGEMRIRKDTVDAILNPSVAPAERSE
jgi:hypothetical protein